MQAKKMNQFFSLILAFVTVAVLMGVPQPASAAAFTVDFAGDEISEDGRCSLREAIIATNENRPFGGCPAGSPNGMDVIYLPPNMSFKLSRTDQEFPDEPDAYKGDLDITDSLTIIGSGSGADNTTVIYPDPNVPFFNRIIHIHTEDASDTVFLTNLRIAAGNATGAYEGPFGGGIFNDGSNLTINRVTIKGNRSSQTGGGIASNTGSKLVVTASTITGNTSFDGGGIFNQGTLRVTNALFEVNTATNSGGGLKNNVMDNASATLINVTFNANTSPGGAGISSDSSLSVTNSTIYNNNGSGISVADSGTIENSIIAGVNTTKNCQFGPGATFSSLGHNIEDKNDCRLNEALGDIRVPSGSLLLVEANLGDHGGPTQTLKLLENSPAIDAGNNARCPKIDQRMYARPVNGTCDIGAFEYGAAPALVYLPRITR